MRLSREEQAEDLSGMRLLDVRSSENVGRKTYNFRRRARGCPIPPPAPVQDLDTFQTSYIKA